MAYLNKDYILQKVTDNKLIYWKVEAAGQGHPIDQQREEISIIESANKLEGLLETLSAGVITITASPIALSGRGGDRSQMQQFKVKLEDSIKPINGQPEGGQNIGLLDRIKALEVSLVEQKYQRLLEDKDRELRELREGSTTDKLINGLLPIMAAKFGGVPSAVPGIAGTEETPGQRIKAALMKLQTVDKDLPGTMEALAKFAEKSPEQYNQYLTMLKSQV
jgi:hypothetical protein